MCGKSGICAVICNKPHQPLGDVSRSSSTPLLEKPTDQHRLGLHQENDRNPLGTVAATSMRVASAVATGYVNHQDIPCLGWRQDTSA